MNEPQIEARLSMLETAVSRVAAAESDYGSNLYGGQPDGSLPRKFDDRGALPAGLIVMWSGDPAALPPGWLLCDGTEGTPDLSARFIVGYKSGDADYGTVGNTGGYKWHGQTENNHNDHKLKHYHDLQFEYADLEGTAGTDVLTSCWIVGVTMYDPALGTPCNSDFLHWCGSDSLPDYDVPDDAAADEDRALHYGASNSNQDTDNRPPYYVLAFIMKA